MATSVSPFSNSSTQDFAVTQFADEPISYIAPSWGELSDLAYRVARSILDQRLTFDRIVTLAKGGWPMTRSLVDFLKVDRVASIGVKFYAGINQHMAEPEIYQELPTAIAGEKILLFDDVADTGRSLQFVAEYLGSHGAARVTTATLFYKPHSVIRPDFFGSQTSDWIIFPYEMVESLQVLAKQWRELGIPDQEIITRFVQLGFPSDRVTHYISDLSTTL